MKLAGSTWSFLRSANLVESFRLLAEIGAVRVNLLATAPHLSSLVVDAATANAVLTGAQAAGVAIDAIDLPFLDQNFASPNLEMRDFTVAQGKRMVDLAQRLDARYITMLPGRMPPPSTLPAPKADFVAWLREGCDRLVPYAEAAGVRLLFENHPISVLGSVAELAQFASEYSGTIQIAYDVANAELNGENQGESLRAVAPWMAQLHLADAAPQHGVHDPIGRGSIDFGALLRTVQEIGFAGTCLLEVVSPDPDRHLRESLTQLRTAGWDFLSAGSNQPIRS